MLFCFIDSHVEGEPYPNLLHDKGGAGYPYLCFMTAAGDVVARQRASAVRADGVAAFEKTLAQDVQAYFALEKAARSGDKKAQAEFFMTRFDLGHLSSAELQAAIKRPDFLSQDQLALIRERLMELRVEECIKGVDPTRPETFGPYAKKLLALHKTIGLPEGPAGINPWYIILEDAYRRRDVRTFQMAFTALKAAGLGSRKAFVDKRQKQLEELRRGTE